MMDIPRTTGRKEQVAVQDRVVKPAVILGNHAARGNKEAARQNEKYLGSYHSKNPYVDLTFGESDQDRFRSSQSSIKSSYYLDG